MIEEAIKGLVENDMDFPIMAHRVTFRHIYYSNGFNTKDHHPVTKHACMQSGYWCPRQLREDGQIAIVSYLKHFGIKNPKTVMRAIK